jgi:hypothetical protein
VGSRLKSRLERAGWRVVWLALKSLELAGVPTNFRSDSLISMV